MLARQIGKLLRHSYSRAIVNCRNVSSGNVEADAAERDPAPFFFDKEVQKSLRRLTTVDYKKVFRPRMDGHRLRRPEYKFMTDEELQAAMDAAKRKANRYLQMPPVVKQRSEITTVLVKDAALLDHDTVKYVFTDITFGLKDRERIVVVREPDGMLRHANWQERDRLMQTYFPKPGKDIRKPRMFGGKYLESLLERSKYEFILDRACIQFDPDDPDYQAVTRAVYERINLEKHFEALRSTRHFGPMVFHLVWTSNIDNLLCEMIETDRMEDAVLLIRLYHKIHPTAESAVNRCKDDSSDEEIVMHYARFDSARTTTIEKLVQSYKELHQQRKLLEEGIKKAHGLTSNQVETDKV
ncbi:28S ribosomal protein S22, mitochondrial [Ooceraea biroi]|uniref:28S ribosomal protein S22, mitochondrial n=1 Tax=Ooceraea biroi TaxID=2015173 RepID=A0A026WIV3_OOCBI|nr:28S ribosomal protein S22, mitochondrial [Ooceraea biroi]